jgi:hypothetical protein
MWGVVGFVYVKSHRHFCNLTDMCRKPLACFSLCMGIVSKAYQWSWRAISTQELAKENPKWSFWMTREDKFKVYLESELWAPRNPSNGLCQSGFLRLSNSWLTALSRAMCITTVDCLIMHNTSPGWVYAL